MKNLLSIALIFSAAVLWAQPSVLQETAEKLSAQGNYPASNDSLSSFINRYSVRRYEVGAAYFLRSYNHLQMGNLEAAAEDNEASMAIRQALIPEEVGKNLMRSGYLALEKGRYDEALELLSEAKGYPYIDEPELPALIDQYEGQAYAHLGNLPQAREAYQEAIEVLEVVGDTENSLKARLHYLLAETYQADQKWGEAKKQLERSLSTSKAAWPGKLETYFALGALHLNTGDELAALSYYQQALQFARETAVAQSPRLAEAFLHLARFYRTTNNKKKGELAVQQGLQVLCPDFNSQAVEDYPKLDNFCGSWELLAALLSLKTSFRLQDYALYQDASLLEEAQRISQLSLDAFEQHALLFATPGQYAGLLQSYSGYYAAAISIALARAEAQGLPKEKERAFQLAERARLLPKRLEVAKQEVDGPRAGLETEERGLMQNLNELRARYQLEPDLEKWQKGLYDQRRAYLGFIASLQRQDSSYYAERYAMEVPSLEEVRSKLGRKEVLISYVLAEKEYFIFAISRRKYEAVSLPLLYPGILARGEMPEERSLNSLLEEYPEVIAANNTARFAKLSPLLYHSLLGPVDKVWRHKKIIMVSIPAQFEGFPLHTLIDNEKDAASYKQLSEVDNGYEIRIWRP